MQCDEPLGQAVLEAEVHLLLWEACCYLQKVFFEERKYSLAYVCQRNPGFDPKATGHRSTLCRSLRTYSTRCGCRPDCMDDMSEVPQFVRAPIVNGCDSISAFMDDEQHDDSDVEEIPDERIPRNSSASDDTKVTLLLKCKSKLDIDTINNIAKTLLQAPNCRWTCASAPSTQCHERTNTFEFTTSRSVVAGNTLLVIEDAATAALPYPEHVKGIDPGFGKPVALVTIAGASCQVRSICNVRMQQKVRMSQAIHLLFTSDGRVCNY